MSFEFLEESRDAGALFNAVQKNLKEAGIPYPDNEAKEIIRHRMGLSMSDIVMRTPTMDKRNALSLIQGDLEKRLQGWTLDRIYGEKSFYDLTFSVNEHVLSPRPETEILVEEALKLNSPKRILDLGTGSGCILLTLLNHIDGAAGIGIDKSFESLKTAKTNAKNLGLADRVHWICGDWSESLEGEFDLIVSNPPYIREADLRSLSQDVKMNDPILALDGGENGLQAYKEILMQINSRLSKNGTVLFEIGCDQQEGVKRLIEKAGFFVSKCMSDYAGHPRIVGFSRDPQWG